MLIGLCLIRSFPLLFQTSGVTFVSCGKMLVRRLICLELKSLHIRMCKGAHQHTDHFQDHFIFFLFFSIFSLLRNSIPSGDSGQYSLSFISLAMHDVMVAWQPRMQHALTGWMANACSALDLTALMIFVCFFVS